MGIIQYGFIVKAKNYHGLRDTADLNTDGFSTHIIGVCDDEQAIWAASEMIKNGVQVIELCGGFGPDSAKYISECLNTEIPIGYVTFNEQENAKLDRILADSIA